MKTKLMLSPCLLVIENSADDYTQMQHFSNLSVVIDFITKYLQDSAEFDYYENAPYENYQISPPDYGKGSVLNGLACTLFQKVQKMLSGNFVDLKIDESASLISNYALPAHPYTQTYLRYASYVLTRGFKGLIFLGMDNYDLVPSVRFINGNIDAIGNLETDIYSSLNSLLPFDDDPIFPRSHVCKNANHVVRNKSKGLTSQEKRALYIKYGTIVAERNLYKYDSRLSLLNTKRQRNERKVFTQESGNYYLSIDFESGGFELFDKHLVHLGQYNFSCQKVKDNSPSDHKLFVK